MIRDILIRARAIITPQNNWTHQAFARGQAGGACPVTSRRACSWCASGAIQLAVAESEFPEFVNTLREVPNLWSHPLCNGARRVVGDVVGAYATSVWNDRSTHSEVLAAFDAAIAGCAT